MKAMKRFIIFSALVLGVISCQKPEQVIDYSGEVTVYRVCDASCVKPIDQPAMGRNSFLCYFCSSPTDREVFILDVALNGDKALVKGEAFVPKTVLFVNPYDFGPLGNTKSIGKGTLRYMGEENGYDVIRFEDVTFKVTRTDGSNITDTYYIRGTSRFSPPPQF
jgi:hypothetical protein